MYQIKTVIKGLSWLLLAASLLACQQAVDVPPTGSPVIPEPPEPPPGPEDPVEPDPGGDGGFTSLTPEQWDELAVRKVLRTFAYGGLTTDEKIRTWADTDPDVAIRRMLTFDYINPALSPPQDGSANYGYSLEALQTYWGRNNTDNPVLWSNREGYSSLTSVFFGYLSLQNMQRTWAQAVNTRGVNPFLHKIAHYLTNYQMAITGEKISLFRPYYDEVVNNLVEHATFTDLIADASKSAAVAMRYEHKANIYNNNKEIFAGNDDFAREYFQLFFRINGEGEEEYHEGVSIENNAKLLTGMNIDRDDFLGGSGRDTDWWLAPIVFTDHVDDTGREIKNLKFHHQGCLEVLHSEICGTTAAEKIDNLSQVAASHPEAMSNLPVYIIQTLADDQLTEDEQEVLRKEWAESNDDLLLFIRKYAISTAFHSTDTIKYQNGFDRNLAIFNAVVLDNHEALTAKTFTQGALNNLLDQGAAPHMPAHDVFGGQTGLEAYNSTGIFKHAYDDAVDGFGDGLFIYESTYYADRNETELVEWVKDWSAVVPPDGVGGYRVGAVVDWLWNRMVADGGKNLDVMARAQLLALLAEGKDFGLYIAENHPGISSDPTMQYSSAELQSDEITPILQSLELTDFLLDSADPELRRQASINMSLASAFISALPYTFVMEGR